MRLDGELVGLAPLVVHRRGPFRIARVLGEDPSDYWDVLARPDLRGEVCGAVAGALVERRGEWDALVLSHLVPGSALPEAARNAGLRLFARSTAPYPRVELPASFDKYLESVSRNRRSNLRRHLRRLDEGEVTLHEVEDPAEVPAAVARWQELHVTQWRELGKSVRPEHATPRFRALLSEALAAMVPAGLAAVWEFSQSERVVGSYVNFTDRRSFYQYLGGFDPEVGRLGLGKLSIIHGIRSSIEQGREHYDFMLGSEQHKYFFEARDRQVESATFRSSRPASRIATGLLTGRARVKASLQGAE